MTLHSTGTSSSAADQPRIHICIGNEQHYEQIKLALAAGPNRAHRKTDIDWWNISDQARAGDRVAVFIKGRSTFVATGTVVRKLRDEERFRNSEFDGPSCFWIDSHALLPREVHISVVRDQLSYLRGQVARGMVKPEIASRFLALLEGDPPLTPVSNDFEAPPKRIETTIYRILRDTAKARRVKEWYAHECQICGKIIALPDGARYAEAHHIKPLGTPHNGPDEIGNILCLCPNHHAEVDLGARRLTLGELRRCDNHQVDPEFIDYHNSEICFNDIAREP